MSLDDIVSVTITRNTKTPTRKGFGTALLAVQKVPTAWGSARVRSFSSLTELIDAGFVATDPAYLMASLLKSQNPAPKSFKIGRRLLPSTKSVTLTVTNATVGFVYAFFVAGHALTYTVLSAATTTTVATALAALIDALSEVASTASGAVITITAAAGIIFDISGWAQLGNAMTLLDNTTDPGIATDLAAFATEDNDWYGLAIDSAGALEQLAAAAWVEANEKIFPVDSSASGDFDSVSTTDAMYAAKALSYARSGWMHSKVKLLHWSSCAWLGSRLPVPPGSDTWKFKTLAGVAVSPLTDGQKSAIFTKKGNTYTTVAGVNMTEEGWTAAGEFFDVIRFIDWLKAEIQIAVFALLVNAPKIPFTDAGVDMVKSVIQDRLAAGVKAGGLAKNPAPTVDAPLVADVSTLDKATRNLPDVTFTGKLAGAIHAITISGTVSV